MRNFHSGMVWQVWVSSVLRVVVLCAVLGGLVGAVHGEVYVVDRLNGACTGNNFDCGDGRDAQPGDGVAEIFLGGGSTSLRAAIEEANALEGHDYIMLPEKTLFLRVDLPPLTDPDGVTIMSMQDGNFILDGSTVTKRLLAYRDLLVANFTDLDVEANDALTFGETQALGGLPDQAALILAIIHNLGGVQQADFDYFDTGIDTGGNGLLEKEELEQFRGAGKAFRVNTTNNEIIGVTLVNFYDGAIVIDGEAADDNTVQGCYIGLLGTDAQDRENARLLLDGFFLADGNQSGGLSLGEAQTIVSGLSSSAFDRLDADADGELSEAELTTAGALLDSEVAQLLLDNFTTADADSSNSLNLSEAQTVVESLATEGFDRLDVSPVDGDGQLSRSELNSALTRGDTAGTSGITNGNREHGIVISGGADNNVIGGSDVSERNVISGNGTDELFEVLDADGKPTGEYITLDFGNGVLITDDGTTNNVVMGNYIGVDVSGLNPVPNAFSGIVIENGASNNTIGGAGAGEGNLIARNGSADDGCFLHCGNGSQPYYGNGVYVHGASTRDNIVQGNTITSNRTAGIKFVNLVSGSIGGAVEGSGNTISGHVASNFISPNIYLGNCANVQVENNRVSGGVTGLRVAGGLNLTIGSPGFGNVFTSMQNGVVIGDGTDIFFYSNFVGVDETGTLAQGNSFSGIFVSDDVVNVHIGGSGAGEGNLISGNENDGIVVHRMTVGAGTDPVLFIQGNKIGTDGTGTSAIPNKIIGVRIGPDARRVQIGGTGDGEGNLISGNDEDGIRVARRLNTTGTPDNIRILGNRIGLAATGTAQVPNKLSGVALLQVGEEVLLGGLGTGESNTIAGNTEYGVRVQGGDVLGITSHATIRGNAIYGNGMKGIFLEQAGNDDIAAPTVVSVDPLSGTALPNTTVDLYSDDGDQGEFHLGFATADSNGDFALTFDIGTLPGGSNITATTTDPVTGNTSEFSAPLPLTPPTFSTQPSAVSVVEGEPFSLTVAASGSEPITYQWEVLPSGASEFVNETDDTVVSGTQTTTLGNSAARLDDAGSYRCVATNILGDTASINVTVTVVPAATDTAVVSTISDTNDGDTQSPAHLLVNPGADGQISLREAIIAANNRAGADTITFTVAGTIPLTSVLPTLEDASGGTTINGGGVLTLDGSALSGGESGLTMTSAGNVVDGIILVNFPGHGIDVVGATATGNRIVGCLVGTNGTSASGNDGHGIEVRDGASDNIIGGATVEERNVVSDNGESGISISGTNTTGNAILGNYIGVNSTGTAALANGAHGILIQSGAATNAVGGTTDGEGNLLSANGASGIYITGAGTSDNTVEGNDIGLNAAGGPDLGNVASGVTIADGATNNTVGGVDSGAGNRIMGNGAGVLIDGAATTGNTVRQNEITGNFGDGITLTNGANGDMPAPVITMLGSVIGTAPSDSIVELFADEGDEGATLIATVTTDGAGDFISDVNIEAFIGLNITATATDASGNTSAFSAPSLVDLEPPVLTLLGESTITLQCGSGAYVDAGATAVDDVDGDITSQIGVTITRDASTVTAVDTTTLGTYIIQYAVSDNAGQAATPVQRTVSVVDTEVPVITLAGNPALIVECHGDYTDAGATATDGCDGDVAVTMTGAVDTVAPGVYVLTYSATDSQGNAATDVTRTVTVADTVHPVIVLTGDLTVTLECGTGYLDAGATVLDGCDAGVLLRTDNPVEPGTTGFYTVRYNATDSSGNAATEVIRVVQVVDTTVPVIDLVGDADVTVPCGVNFEDLGATVLDTCDGDLPVIVSGVVNTSDPGTYTLTYTASDSAGNVAVPVSRIVRVEDGQVPVITLNGASTVDVDCEGVYEELGATAADSCDGDLSDDIVITGSVDTSIAGNYLVNYDVADSFGNVANRVTRTVIVATCPDPCEIQCATDPNNEVDEDGDGLSACVEACLGTSDERVDTDGDGVPDGVEMDSGSDPATPDSDLDLDGDGLSQLEEFIFGSDPNDPNSPAISFFIAPGGADGVAGGSVDSPWSSIEFALSQVSPSATNPIRLILAAGNYPEDVVLQPWVTLVGATGSLPRIEGTVFGIDDSALKNLEIAAFTSDDVMLVMDDVVMTVTDVVFRGSASRPAAGILVDGTRSSGSVVDGCLFTSLSIGIDVAGALPTVRRCTFEDTSIAGVFVRATANISSSVSLGDVTDPSTGSNLFAGIAEGRAIINEVGTVLLAQQNDWGTTSASTISGSLLSGEVDFDPALTPGTATDTASLFVTVWTAADQTRVTTAQVKVTDDSGAIVSVVKNQNGVYALPVLRSGSYTVNVSAFGFAEQDATLTLAAGELGSQIVALQTASIKGGGPSCTPVVGSASGWWTDLLMVVLLLGALLLGQRFAPRRSGSA